MLNKIIQTEKDKYCMYVFSHMQNLDQKKKKKKNDTSIKC
jgi:hypothetical protein